MTSQDFPARYAKIATRHAAIALLWQASDSSESGGSGFPITDHTGYHDRGTAHYGHLDGEGAEYVEQVEPLISEAVTAFVRANFATLTSAKVRAAQCGHDLVLTANRHGTGFWDRGLGAAGEILTEATRGYSFEAEFELFGEDRATDDHCADELAWLMVENTVLLDHIGASA